MNKLNWTAILTYLGILVITICLWTYIFNQFL
jgi:hypothetical protein